MMKLGRVHSFLAGPNQIIQGGAFICSSPVGACHIQALSNLYHQMQFFTLHRMNIFPNFSHTNTNGNKAEFSKKSSFIFYRKNMNFFTFFYQFFVNCIPKKGFKIFSIQTVLQSSTSSIEPCKNIYKKKICSIFELLAPYILFFRSNIKLNSDAQ